MAKTAKKTNSKTKRKEGWRARMTRRLRRYVLLGSAGALALLLVLVLAYSLFNPPTTWTIQSERSRLGEVNHFWVPMDDIAPVVARSVVAAEDANFCRHWGFDVNAIRAAIDAGAQRGASTISQQVVKNAYLWQGRSWLRKAMETAITPLVEMTWSKRRIVEVYLNVAEFDEGVFGIGAAAQHYFDEAPADLSATQAARLASVLPSPKTRSASRITNAQARRVASIVDGAATIDRDGRADCFQ
ncbi:monofunctional biosynthetic peptidoglycan transglycosylase [Cognatishimia maritima]|uniref:Biosynthetic peptidoglycan transglycosylase n=1 Tax=Cognatishimia maritima TaxID=870908 RepID=A0A1M5TBE4_9RHOB|nr:monofunctional biosynthetic peptidoglycan transglycosylase [Cognatishimia maritima]